MQDYLSIALVDEDITNELFTDDGDPEMREMQLELWQGVRRDLLHDLEWVRREFLAGNLDEARRLAHRVAGYSGSGGLKRVGVVLRKLQHAEIPEEQFLPTLDEIAVWSSEGMDEIETRFPYLRSS
jgi:HPt (histidine-containing phosphotransfer) domain-containing protein